MRIPGTLPSHEDNMNNSIPRGYQITSPCGYETQALTQYFILRLPWMCFGNCCSSGLVALTGHWHRFLERIVSTKVTTMVQARKYIYSSLGADFLENAVLDIEHLLEESDNKVSKITHIKEYTYVFKIMAQTSIRQSSCEHIITDIEGDKKPTKGAFDLPSLNWIRPFPTD